MVVLVVRLQSFSSGGELHVWSRSTLNCNLQHAQLCSLYLLSQIGCHRTLDNFGLCAWSSNWRRTSTSKRIGPCMLVANLVDKEIVSQELCTLVDIYTSHIL